jgi:hypothetical protein
VQKVITNAAKWAAPTGTTEVFSYWDRKGWHRPEPLEPIEVVREIEIEHPNV